jgi:hypothetical protein
MEAIPDGNLACETHVMPHAVIVGAEEKARVVEPKDVDEIGDTPKDGSQKVNHADEEAHVDTTKGSISQVVI